MKQVQYNPGRKKAFINVIRNILQEHPHLLEDENYDEFRATVFANIPEMKDKSTCPVCDAKMYEYVFQFDVLDAALLLRMAERVREHRSVGCNFTEANDVKIQDLGCSYSVKSRTTRCSKLGLIAKKKVRKKHLPGHWVITRRGWHALTGGEVPKRVRVWREQIIERTEEKTTISQVMQISEQRRQKMKRDAKRDCDEVEQNYRPTDWYEMRERYEHVIE